MDFKPQSAVLIATIVVANMICWMMTIAAVVLGATHLGNCQVQPNIPIYLVVLGATGIVSMFLTYTMSAFKSGAIAVLSSSFTAFLNIFSFGWLIAGSIWVYRVYPPNYSPGTDRYCHKTTYQFAFIVITLLWVMMALVLVCGGCFCLLTCCRTIIASRRIVPSRYTAYGATNDFKEPSAGDV